MTRVRALLTFVAALLGLAALNGWALRAYHAAREREAALLAVVPGPPMSRKVVPDPPTEPAPERSPSPVPQPAPAAVVHVPSPVPPAPQIEPPKPSSRLTGDALVLVIETTASQLTDPDVVAQLAHLEDEHGKDGPAMPKLLGQRVYRLNREGAAPWDRQAPAAPVAQRFGSDEFQAAFAAAFAEVAKLRRQAVNPQFKTIILWETRDNPDFDPSAEVRPPAGDVFYLVYWFTPPAPESRKVPTWFGETQTGFLRDRKGLHDAVEYYLQRKP